MGLYLLIPTFTVILISILVVRAGGIALRMTGLDENTANFQALSAFTRAGFTTKESETVIAHPQRRVIITWLIVIGNAGIVAAIVTGSASLATSSDYRLAIDIAALLVGVYLIYKLAKHTGITRRWENLVENRLVRGSFFIGLSYVEHLLHLADGYGVARTAITEKSRVSGSSITDSGLADRELIVMAIKRAGIWMSSPKPQEIITEGDVLIIYGKLNTVDEMFGSGRRRNRKVK